MHNWMSPHNQLFDQSRFSAKRQQSRLDKARKILNVYFNVLHFITLYLLTYIFIQMQSFYFLPDKIRKKQHYIITVSHHDIIYIIKSQLTVLQKKKIETFYCTIFKFEFLNIISVSPFRDSMWNKQPVNNNNNTLKNTKSYICMGPIMGRNDILHTQKKKHVLVSFVIFYNIKHE